MSDWCRRLSLLLDVGRFGLGLCLWSVHCVISVVIVVVVVVVLVLIIILLLVVWWLWLLLVVVKLMV